MQDRRLFAHISNGSEETLVFSRKLPPPGTRALYFTREGGTKVTPTNIQVHLQLTLHTSVPGGCFSRFADRAHIEYIEAR